VCNGQILPVADYPALFDLLGNLYGGDGVTTFALPDLRGRAPVHPGDVVSLGQRLGAETVTLSPGHLPPHVHMQGSGDGATASAPTDNVAASRSRTGLRIYAPAGNPRAMASDLEEGGGGQAHPNMQPSLVLNFCIAIQGTVPQSE
jgi:microcystin-dependent protein